VWGLCLLLCGGCVCYCVGFMFVIVWGSCYCVVVVFVIVWGVVFVIVWGISLL